MIKVEELFIEPTATVLETLRKLDETGQRILFIAPQGKLKAVLTDGDLRRMLMKHPNIESVHVKDIMTNNPTTVDKGTLAADALNIMQHRKISVLPVMEDNKYIGMIHIHDIIKEGII